MRRSLAIRTEPPGATVYFNDQLRGETPVDFDFVWYGWQSVTLRKDGFERVDDKRLLKAPFYLWIPLDFFAELLPFHVRDLRTWSYSLTPAQNLPVPQPPADAQEGAVLSEPPVRGEPVPEEAEPAHVEPGEQSTYGPSTGGVERKAIVPESAFATPAGPADDSAEPGSRPKEDPLSGHLSRLSASGQGVGRACL